MTKQCTMTEDSEFWIGDRRLPIARKDRRGAGIAGAVALILLAMAGFLAPISARATDVSATTTNAMLDEATVTRLLATALRQQFVGGEGELDLKFTRPWADKEMPAEPVSLKILDMPVGGIASSFIVRFEIIGADGRSAGNWQMPVQAHLWRDVRVAHSMLKPGARVADADIGRERRDVLALRAPLAEFVDGDPTLEIAESVPAGSPIFARAVKLRAVIHRGEMTNARVEDGALTISIKVEALEDGTPGEIIRLRNLQSNRDFNGKVLDERTVLVSL